MLPPVPGEEEAGRLRKSNTGMFTQIISDARAAEYELVEAGDEDRLFYKLPWWKKVVVMAGGPTVNLVLAFLLFGAVFMIHGAAQDHDDHRRRLRLRDRGDPGVRRAGRARVHRRRPGGARPSRPACSPGDRIVVVQRRAGRPPGTSSAR